MQEAAAVKGRMTQDMANRRDTLSMRAVGTRSPVMYQSDSGQQTDLGHQLLRGLPKIFPNKKLACDLSSR